MRIEVDDSAYTEVVGGDLKVSDELIIADCCDLPS
jgi:hypothetical protein